MTEFSKTPPMPGTLRDEIAGHESASDLERVWQMLEVVEPAGRADAAASSQALWQRIAAVTTDAPALRLVESEPTPARPQRVDTTRDTARDAVAVRAAERTGWRLRARHVALAVAASVAVVAWWGTGSTRVSTPAGSVRTVLLRDGSSVALNGASELEYPRLFRPRWLGGDGQRTVTLRGEGYFRVAKGDAPFIVQTAQAAVRVVGTRFNVNARSAAATARTEVTVEEGLVQVSARGPGATQSPGVLLRANDRVTVDEGASARTANVLRVTRGDARRDLAWTKGGFAAVDQPLREVLSSLEAQYGVELSMRDSAAAAASITLYYPERTTIDRILTDLATARGWTMRRTSRGYELRVAQ